MRRRWVLRLAVSFSCAKKVHILGIVPGETSLSPTDAIVVVMILMVFFCGCGREMKMRPELSEGFTIEECAPAREKIIFAKRYSMIFHYIQMLTLNHKISNGLRHRSKRSSSDRRAVYFLFLEAPLLL